MSKLNERGFTLPELIVATVLIVVLLFVSMLILSPDDYSAQNQDAERRVQIAGIAQGINRYVADMGQLPANIPTVETAIGSPSDHYNLCRYLVPTYVNDIPLDPLLGLKTRSKETATTDPPCSEDGVSYASGYAIRKNRDGSITISAPAADSNVAVTIKPL